MHAGWASRRVLGHRDHRCLPDKRTRSKALECAGEQEAPPTHLREDVPELLGHALEGALDGLVLAGVQRVDELAGVGVDAGEDVGEDMCQPINQ